MSGWDVGLSGSDVGLSTDLNDRVARLFADVHKRRPASAAAAAAAAAANWRFGRRIFRSDLGKRALADDDTAPRQQGELTTSRCDY